MQLSEKKITVGINFSVSASQRTWSTLVKILLPCQSPAIASSVCPSCQAILGSAILGIFTFGAVWDAGGAQQLLYCGVVQTQGRC